ncbi:MAG: choice-of-anchor D domain-containing protein [Ignavibacteria bacterium]|nr:choice-of-anchor D domain-containing protein [Ignavibacteria bacterium]
MFRLISFFALYLLFIPLSSKTQLINLDFYNKENGSFIEFLCLDSSSNINLNLKKEHFRILENHIKITKFNFVPPKPISDSLSSVIFLFDLSIGNLDQTKHKLELVKQLLTSIVRNLRNTEIALIAFDNQNFLLSDFTSEKGKIISQINKITTTKSASNFDTAFLGNYLGAIDYSKKARYPTSIVLITDKNRQISLPKIENLTKNNNLKVYVLSLSKYLSQELTDLSRKTNGFTFNVSSVKDSVKIAQSLNFLTHNGKPANLSWENLPLCFKERLANIIYKDFDTISINFNVENINYPQIVAKPPFLRYSSVIPSHYKDLDLYLIAKNYSIKIDSIKLKNPNFSIVSGDIKAPLILQKDSAHKLTIRFTPSDSAIVFDSLIIYSDACSIKKVNLTGGFPNKKPKEKTLTIISPKCEDHFIIGDTVKIKWEGLLPADVVQLQYTTNNGTSWDTLAVNVLGLEYSWWLDPSKFSESDSCWIRIIQIWPNNAGETIELRHPSSVNSANFNRDASLIVTSSYSSNGFANVWNPGTGGKIFSLQGHTRNVNWASFDNQDRYIITASDDSTAILWDVKNGDSLFTFVGHNGKVTSANFSPDGNYAVTSGTDGKSIVWDLRTKKLIYTLPIDQNPIYFASFTPDSLFIAYASYDGNIYLFDISKLKVTKIFQTNFSNNRINHFSIHLGAKKLAAASHLGLFFVWNYNLEDTAKKVDPLYLRSHDSISFPAINTCYFNSTGNWLITAGSDFRVLRWNPQTGELIDSIAIGEHNNAITSALFSFDDAMLLTSSWDSTVKIFNRTKLGLQIDTNDCAFSILQSKLASYNVDFGRLPLGKSFDTLVSPVIVNNSRIPIKFQNIEIIGVHSNDFKILDVGENLVLNPNDSLKILFNFTPTDTGERVAKILLKHKGGNEEINLKGYSYLPSLVVHPKIIDMGIVEVGEYKDTLLAFVIKNMSIKPVVISSIRNIGPDSLYFTIISGKISELLPPNGTISMTIRFTPDTVGRKNSIILIENNTEVPLEFIQVLAEGIYPVFDSLTIFTENHKGKPGDIIEIPIKTKNKKFQHPYSFYEGIAFDLTFNKTLLEPIENDFESIFDGNYRTLKVFARSNILKDSTLIKLKFKVGLGNDTITTLQISNSYPLGSGKIVLKEESSIFKLENVCLEGGVRLFEPDGLIWLGEPNPNPNTGNFFVDFETIERGPTKILLYDYKGELLGTILEKNLSPGRYRYEFTFRNLSEGIYFLSLQTPTQKLFKTIIIIK